KAVQPRASPATSFLLPLTRAMEEREKEGGGRRAYGGELEPEPQYVRRPPPSQGSKGRNNRPNNFPRLHRAKSLVHFVELDRARHHRARVETAGLDEVGVAMEVAAHLT